MVVLVALVIEDVGQIDDASVGETSGFRFGVRLGIEYRLR